MPRECPKSNDPVLRDTATPLVIGHRSLIGPWTLGLGHCLLALLVLTSCSRDSDQPGKLSAREGEIISIARRTLDQQEDWVDKAEFKIAKRGSRYEVTAWKVVYPEAKGNLRYVPWGRSTMLIEDYGRVVEYRKGK